MASVLTVNTAPVPRELTTRRSGIDKRPSAEPLEVRAPGPRKGGLGSGVVGDSICDSRHHGGDDQAVYAYAREDLDRWQAELDRDLPNGAFGENMTTAGVDLSACVIGERWALGADGPLLEVTSPRTPCRTFADWMGVPGWMKTFTTAVVPGAYFRVLEPGRLCAGAQIEVVSRPDHDVTIGTVFRAMMIDPQLFPSLAPADALPADIKRKVTRRTV